MVSEWFPSGFQVVLACSKPVRRLVRGVCPGFLGPQSCPEACPGVCPGVCPGLLGPQSCPEGCSGVCPGVCPGFLCPQSCPEGCPGARRFCALKAVRRVVPGFVRGFVRGFEPVWTQNVKTGVYAEPPLSNYQSILRHSLNWGPLASQRRCKLRVGCLEWLDSGVFSI